MYSSKRSNEYVFFFLAHRVRHAARRWGSATSPLLDGALTTHVLEASGLHAAEQRPRPREASTPLGCATQEKCGAPQVQSRRFPWHTPSKEGFFTAKEGSRGVANARAWHWALA